MIRPIRIITMTVISIIRKMVMTIKVQITK